VVLLPGALAADAFMRAEQLRRRAAELVVESGGARLSRTVSIGLAAFPGDGKTAKELFAAADAALYDAKRAGRDRTCAAASTRTRAAG
jgi:diguanylate cyclase (GGDEF)-like protein